MNRFTGSNVKLLITCENLLRQILKLQVLSFSSVLLSFFHFELKLTQMKFLSLTECFRLCFLNCGSRPRQRSQTRFLEGRHIREEAALSQLVSVRGRETTSLSCGSQAELALILYSAERLPSAVTCLQAFEEFCSAMRNVLFEKLHCLQQDD